MKKIVNFILGSACFGLMVIYITLSDFTKLVSETLGDLWAQIRDLFSYQEWSIIGLSVSISLSFIVPVLLFSIWHERKYGLTIEVALGHFLKNAFSRKRKAKIENSI